MQTTLLFTLTAHRQPRWTPGLPATLTVDVIPSHEPAHPHRMETAPATPAVGVSKIRLCGTPTALSASTHTPAAGSNHAACQLPDYPAPSAGTSESSSHGPPPPASPPRTQDPRIRLKDATAAMLRALLAARYDPSEGFPSSPQPSATGSPPQSPSLSSCGESPSSSPGRDHSDPSGSTPAVSLPPRSTADDVSGCPCPICGSHHPEEKALNSKL